MEIAFCRPPPILPLDPGDNNAIVNADNAVIAGGGYNVINANSENTSILGGKENEVGTINEAATILGGIGNNLLNGVNRLINATPKTTNSALSVVAGSFNNINAFAAFAAGLANIVTNQNSASFNFTEMLVGPAGSGGTNFLEDLAADFAVLRSDQKAWAEELAEREAWDATLADGLEND